MTRDKISFLLYAATNPKGFVHDDEALEELGFDYSFQYYDRPRLSEIRAAAIRELTELLYKAQKEKE